MTKSQKRTYVFVSSLALATTILGFIAWWSFALVAFAGSFYLVRQDRLARPVVSAMLAPPIGWIIMAAIRDLMEGGRISAKLATLLHVQFAIVVYVLLFLIVLVPSFFAAFSGGETSKALR